MTVHWETLIKEMRQGSVRALARLVTHVENRAPGWMDAMKRIYAQTGSARLIGITGSPVSFVRFEGPGGPRAGWQMSIKIGELLVHRGVITEDELHHLERCWLRQNEYRGR